MFKFKQSVYEYLSKAKELRSAELNSAAFNQSHRSTKSNHSGRSNLSSLSSKSKLIKAKTRVAALEVEAAFLKDKQALKMAEEQLELKKNLAKAMEEERIYEQMNNEELVSIPTCLHTQKLPKFPVSSLFPANITKDANVISLSIPRSVVTMTTTAMMTSSQPSNAISVLEPASKSLPVYSSDNHVSGHQKPSPADPLCGYSIGQIAPIYTSPTTACKSGNAAFDFETYVDIVIVIVIVRPVCSSLTPRMVRQWSPPYFATDWQDYIQQDSHWSRGHSNDPSRICSLEENGTGADNPAEREKGTAMSREDIQFCETVDSGFVHLEDLHYEMSLPFKHPNIQLPNNYAQAEKGLIGLKRRLKADERYCADYCSFMSDIISKGYARKADDEFKDEVGRTWYLPHHGIYHPQKAKVRVVFDCSATFEGHSLNEKKTSSGTRSY